MANIVRKNPEGSSSIAPLAGGAWDPLRMMRDLLRWDPFREMAPTLGMEERGLGFQPMFEVKETKDGYIFRADLPGVKEDDLDISLTGNRLTVAGKREAEARDENETYYMYERSYGSFARSFTLPEGVDDQNVHADMRDGVLTLTLAKKPEHQPRKISVKKEGAGAGAKAKA